MTTSIDDCPKLTAVVSALVEAITGVQFERYATAA